MSGGPEDWRAEGWARRMGVVMDAVWQRFLWERIMCASSLLRGSSDSALVATADSERRRPSCGSGPRVLPSTVMYFTPRDV